MASQLQSKNREYSDVISQLRASNCNDENFDSFDVKPPPCSRYRINSMRPPCELKCHFYNERRPPLVSPSYELYRRRASRRSTCVTAFMPLVNQEQTTTNLQLRPTDSKDQTHFDQRVFDHKHRSDEECIQKSMSEQKQYLQQKKPYGQRPQYQQMKDE